MRDTYVPNFKVPVRRKPSRAMITAMLLCVLMPPLGLVLLWGKVRCPLRGKLWISSISLACMVAGMTLLIGWRERANYAPPPVPVTYTYGEAQSAEQALQAPQGALPDAQGAPQQDAQEPDAEAPGDGVVPANPMG
ncbi:MAG: hypothetical protein VB067_14900 [Christensenellaceae bacterium]|nr:hypothetical protein [Christensenellaceae bacterium]MEA5070279.1 hypothetical protein [Christensenellaceae bacterium]